MVRQDVTEQAKRLWAESRMWPWWSSREQRNFLRRARRLARKVDPNLADHLTATMVLDNLETRLGRKIWPVA